VTVAHSQSAAPSDDDHYFLNIGGRIYGPYGPDRVRSFLGEGRINASTLIARSRVGPFHPADEALDDAIKDFKIANARPTQFLLAGQFGAAGDAIVEDTLLSMGAATPIAAGLWLLTARVSSAEVRNRLSARLGRDDVFVVAKIDGRDTAWFNLGGDVDGALRDALDCDQSEISDSPLA